MKKHSIDLLSHLENVLSLSFYPAKNLVSYSTDTYSAMFISALFTILRQ